MKSRGRVHNQPRENVKAAADAETEPALSPADRILSVQSMHRSEAGEAGRGPSKPADALVPPALGPGSLSRCAPLAPPWALPAAGQCLSPAPGRSWGSVAGHVEASAPWRWTEGCLGIFPEGDSSSSWEPARGSHTCTNSGTVWTEQTAPALGTGSSHTNGCVCLCLRHGAGGAAAGTRLDTKTAPLWSNTPWFFIHVKWGFFINTVVFGQQSGYLC